jgi:hypothetical protein
MNSSTRCRLRRSSEGHARAPTAEQNSTVQPDRETHCQLLRSSTAQSLAAQTLGSSEAVLSSPKAGILCELNLSTQAAPAKAPASTCSAPGQAGDVCCSGR